MVAAFCSAVLACPPASGHMLPLVIVFLENIKEDEDGDSAWLRRFGTKFEGLRIPFGSGVEYLPVPTVRSGQPQSKMEPALAYGIMLGYKMLAGGGGVDSTLFVI